MAQPQVRLPERAGYRRRLCRCRGHQGDGPPAYHRTSTARSPFRISADRKPLRIAGETVYKNLLTDLNAAIVVLKEYAANAGDARPLQKVDAVYQGDYAKWLKRPTRSSSAWAVRIRFVEPALARTYAEEAVRDGVMTASGRRGVAQEFRVRFRCTTRSKRRGTPITTPAWVRPSTRT